MLERNELREIEQVIGYNFKDKNLLSQAFIRSSYSHDYPEVKDNELLELIGDSVLSLIVMDNLVDRYVTKDSTGLNSRLNEGELSAIRSNLVNKKFLADRIRKMGIGKYLKMGMSDTTPDINLSKSIFEDLFESIVGAIFLDTNKNFIKTSSIVCNMVDINRELNDIDGIKRISYKNDLQEWCQRNKHDLPIYDTTKYDDGYKSICTIALFPYISDGVGHNKKDAENDAAKNMLNYIDIDNPYADTYDLKYENAINLLQEYCIEEKIKLPEYQLISDTINDDNSHTFIVRCYMDDYDYYFDGQSATKKDAKKQAAFGVLKRLIKK